MTVSTGNHWSITKEGGAHLPTFEPRFRILLAAPSRRVHRHEENERSSNKLANDKILTLRADNLSLNIFTFVLNDRDG